MGLGTGDPAWCSNHSGCREVGKFDANIRSVKTFPLIYSAPDNRSASFSSFK